MGASFDEGSRRPGQTSKKGWLIPEVLFYGNFRPSQGAFYLALSPRPRYHSCNPLRVRLSYCHAKTLIFLRSSLSVLSSARSSWESERSSFAKNSYYISGNWGWIGRPWRSWKNSQAVVWILWGETEGARFTDRSAFGWVGWKMVLLKMCIIHRK